MLESINHATDLFAPANKRTSNDEYLFNEYHKIDQNKKKSSSTNNVHSLPNQFFIFLLEVKQWHEKQDDIKDQWEDARKDGV